MKWKVEVRGSNPTERSVRVLTEHSGSPLDEVLMAFSSAGKVTCRGLSENEAQETADSLRRDPGLECRVLPDSSPAGDKEPAFRVILVNYRPGFRTRLRRRLQELTRLPQDQIILWLSKMPFALSKNVSSEIAMRIKNSISEAGGIVRIEREGGGERPPVSSRKTGVIFRTGARHEEDDGVGEIFKRENKKDAPEPASSYPPVSIPENYAQGPPPLDKFETGSGVMVLFPPSRFTPGTPAVTHSEGNGVEPPVLPEADGEEPLVLEFAPPERESGSLPPVVGSEEMSAWTDEPSPPVALLYPPPASVPAERLLPPLISRSEPAGLQDRTVSESAESETDPFENTDLFRNRLSNTGIPVRLFLCQPAPDDEDTVARALREILGVSLRESWDFLRKSPALLKTFARESDAVRTAHRLEEKGVTVSLTRGDAVSSVSSVAGEGFKAWLQKDE